MLHFFTTYTKLRCFVRTSVKRKLGGVIERYLKTILADVPYFTAGRRFELDLVIVNGNDVRLAIEIKLSNAR
jgi:hypothetical protein